jgi:hypothetical protein
MYFYLSSSALLLQKQNVNLLILFLKKVILTNTAQSAKCNIQIPIFLQLASDIVYLLCVNGLGLYFRLMSEVAIRRTFLDRRACLESNSKVEYEKQQEVSFIRNKIFTLRKFT